MDIKVSIIITAHNYGKWLPQAIDSALGQNYEALEVVVVNDGSTDDTAEILHNYAHEPRLRVVTTDGIGLAGACNRGIEKSVGEYIVRLDADDWFDENLVLVLANYLDRHPNIGLVFCDYIDTDVYGEIIDYKRRQVINDEIRLLDRSAPAAGAMYRRQCYDTIGGYNEAIRYQEDYDFWIKIVEKFQVRNISLPLMFHRLHGKSMSRNFAARMKTRRWVKKEFLNKFRDPQDKKNVLAVIPARADMLEDKKIVLAPFDGSTLLAKCVNKVQSVYGVDRVVVFTEDLEISESALGMGAEVPYLRSKTSVSSAVPVEQGFTELLQWLKQEEGYQPELIVMVHPLSPFIMCEHISEALDSMEIFGSDSVIAVTEDLSYHWQVGRSGLQPVGYTKRVVKQEKDLTYKESGGFYVLKIENLQNGGKFLGEKIGHIELAPSEALRIKSAYDFWVAEQMVKEPRSW